MKVVSLLFAGTLWMAGNAAAQCTAANGLPVPYVANEQLREAVRAGIVNGSQVIFINPGQVGWLNPITFEFLKAHECMHLAVPTTSDTEADRSAAFILVRTGILNAGNIALLLNDIAQLTGEGEPHPNGETRVQRVLAATRAAGLGV